MDVKPVLRRQWIHIGDGYPGCSSFFVHIDHVQIGHHIHKVLACSILVCPLKII